MNEKTGGSAHSAPKPGVRVTGLDAEDLRSLFDHPALSSNLQSAIRHVTNLRDCVSAEDFYRFQRQLLSDAYLVDNRRAESTKAAKRLRHGRVVPPGIEPPHDGAATDAVAWEREAFVHERLFRQLRAIGDGLAWRVFEYDRTIIAALSSNKSPGPLVKQAGSLDDDATGLTTELRRIDEVWNERKHFALHHDLTNCLRIGDLTEVESPGRYLLHEVKTNPNNRSSTQHERMRVAVRSIVSGGPLPSSGRRVIELNQTYRTDLQKLIDLVALARQHGVKAAKLEHGRALVVTSFTDLERVTVGNVDDGRARFDSARRSALRRTGIDTDTHHLRGVSGDLAARAPLLPPWAIYPLRPEECAGLICDAIVFEVVVSTAALARLLELQGLAVEVLAGTGELDAHAGVFRISHGNRVLNVYPNSISSLFYELLHPAVWAEGTAELIRRPIPMTDVMHRYRNDHAPWLP